MAIFGPKPWVNPFGKMSIFLLLELLVFIAQKGVFSPQNIEKVGKMAIFGPKPWASPFGKMSIFRLFEPLVYIAQKGVFSLQSIAKAIFLALIAYKKKVEKWPFLDQNHELTPLEKCQLFLLIGLFVFIAQRGVCLPRISYKKFFCFILPKIKSWKNGHFSTETMG